MSTNYFEIYITKMLTTIETIVSITTRRNKIGMHFFSVNKSIIFLSDEFHQFRFIVTISLTEFETFINLSSQKNISDIYLTRILICCQNFVTVMRLTKFCRR